MRVSKIELAVVVFLVAVLAVSYNLVTPLLQGVTAEREWTYWTMYANTYTKVRDIIPLEIIVEALVAVAVIYTLGFKRKVIWLWFATHAIPSWLAQTSVARVAETYLTDNHRMQRKALEHVPQDAKVVIDVGCGGAAYLTGLKGIRKVGLDVNPKRLRIARHYCDEVVQGDITEHGVLDNLKADAVLCFEVIEHLTDEQGICLLKGLEKFSTVILTTPREWFEVRRDGYERHLSFWPPEKLSQYGYELVDSGRIPPSNIYVRRGRNQ